MDKLSLDPGQIGLFALADRRLAWLGARQNVLGQNVANADTPGWKARDLRPFADVLASHRSPDAGSVVTTNPLHMQGTALGEAAGQILRGEQAPDGNAVALDEQMVKIADTDSAHEMVSAIYQKYLGMFRMALGR